MQIHSRQKPYKCKVCDQCFSQSGHLTTHMDFRSGPKPYKCKVYDQSF